MLATNRLYFIIGDTRIDVLSYKNKNLVESYSCEIANISSDTEFQKFLEKNRNSNAKFIINSKEIKLEHESLPVIDSIGKIDPIEKYCASNLHSTDICSYKVYSIIKGQAEIWKGVICWIPLTETIQKCLYLIKENGIAFEAVYFYNFCVQQIATDISWANKVNLSEYMYTTISISKSSGVVITLNNQGNILSEVRCDYPVDKSLEYLQGVVEQNVSDIWLKFKALTSETEVKKANIFIIPDKLKDLLEKSKSEVECNLFAQNIDEDEDSIKALVRYFAKSKQQDGVSYEIKSYQRYQFINSLFFIPYCAVMLFMLVYIAYLKFSVYQLDRTSSELYNNYSKVSEEIRSNAQNFPEIANISQLADLYNLRSQLTEKKPLPFGIIEDFLRIANNDLEVNKISWSQKGDSRSMFTFSIDIEIGKSNKQETFTKTKVVMDQLAEIYKNTRIQLQRVENSGDDDQNTGDQFLRIFGVGE